MTTDVAPSGWGSTIEKELEMIAVAYGTWIKRQANNIFTLDVGVGDGQCCILTGSDDKTARVFQLDQGEIDRI
ncbi:MAG: hypothetical protein EZS28_048877 [Streblomastix strix]|uniref:Uncharacterized protein n=1 Tax=Streblomastix strix TaxID=222440 RepID=A0A5J4TB33_9EUKA|nr:MAG: hypothetical protein EZS28_048877 [Streblomastix strix]